MLNALNDALIYGFIMQNAIMLLLIITLYQYSCIHDNLIKCTINIKCLMHAKNALETKLLRNPGLHQNPVPQLVCSYTNTYRETLMDKCAV